MAESKKSIFKPSNPKKYKGNINNIICRSNWEKIFCKGNKKKEKKKDA